MGFKAAQTMLTSFIELSHSTNASQQKDSNKEDVYSPAQLLFRKKHRLSHLSALQRCPLRPHYLCVNEYGLHDVADKFKEYCRFLHYQIAHELYSGIQSAPTQIKELEDKAEEKKLEKKELSKHKKLDLEEAKLQASPEYKEIVENAMNKRANFIATLNVVTEVYEQKWTKCEKKNIGKENKEQVDMEKMIVDILVVGINLFAC